MSFLDFILVGAILGFLVFSTGGCAPCKKGQVNLDGECYWPGHTYTTTMTGETIRE